MPLLRRAPVRADAGVLLLATGLWLLVAGEQTVERTMRIPLEFTNLPAHLELAGDAPETVDVRVRGASASLSRLTTGDLMAVLDLRQAKPGSGCSTCRARTCAPPSVSRLSRCSHPAWR